MKSKNIFSDAVFGDTFKTKNGLKAIFIDKWIFNPMDGNKPYTRVSVVLENGNEYFYYSNGRPESYNMRKITNKDDEYETLRIVARFKETTDSIQKYYQKELTKEYNEITELYSEIGRLKAENENLKTRNMHLSRKIEKLTRPINEDELEILAVDYMMTAFGSDIKAPSKCSPSTIDKYVSYKAGFRAAKKDEDNEKEH